MKNISRVTYFCSREIQKVEVCRVLLVNHWLTFLKYRRTKVKSHISGDYGPLANKRKSATPTKKERQFEAQINLIHRQKLTANDLK